jgi:type VI secretion system protein ImpL
VLPLCTTAFNNRYPFFPNGPADVPLDDFTKLLAPKGLIDQFFADNLKPLVDTSNLPWKWAANNASLGLSTDALMQFQRTAEIRDGLFSGGPSMLLKFELVPQTMDSGIAQFSLDLDGQRLAYKHGPPEPTKVQWPGPAGRNQIRLVFTPVGGGKDTVIEQNGPWALFRLLDSAKVTSAGRPDQFTVTFTANGQSVTYQLTASSVINPFTMTAVRQFRCPATL